MLLSSFYNLRKLRNDKIKLFSSLNYNKCPQYYNNFYNLRFPRFSLRNIKNVDISQSAQYSSSIDQNYKNRKEFNSSINVKYKESVIKYSSWLEKYLPPKLLPYALLARLDKPIGTWLLYLPCSMSRVFKE